MSTFQKRARLSKSGQQPWRQVCRASIAAATAITVPVVTFASLFYWTGNHDANWNTNGGTAGTNWSSSPDFNNATGGVPGAADSVVFALFGAQNLNSSLGADFSINGITFTPDVQAATPVTVGGTNTLTLGAGGLTNNTAASVTLSTNVALGAAQTWTNNSTAQPLFVSGVISDSTGKALTLGGAGAFNFAGANTYTGATNVSTFGANLTLSGANGSIATTASISLNAGTSLVLDSTAANHSSQNRIADSTTITSRGGTISLIGNSGTPTTETLGTLSIGSGATTVQVSNGSTLTLGTTGTIPSLARSVGGTVDFVIPAGSVVNTPNVTVSNGIIAGWAVVGSYGGSGINWATTDGSQNIVPFSSYQTFSTASAATDNAKYNATGNTSINLTANLTVNSLYLTGGSTPVTGITATGGTKTYYNGITFGNGVSAGSTVLLTIGSGGIISSGATGVGHYNNKADTPNMAFIGYLYDESGGSTGQITSGTGDLVVFTDSGLRIASNIVNNGTTPVGLTKSGPGVLDISNGNTQSFKAGNAFTGKVVLNDGTLIIDREDQLGNSVAAGFVADALTFNGGELLTLSGTTASANRGMTVGTRGGIVAFSGGSNTVMTAKITGSGSFSLYSRQAGGGGGQTMHFNIPAVGGVPASTYQGATNLWLSYSDGANGSGGHTVGGMTFDTSNQIPVTSPVNANMVDDTNAHNIVANGAGGTFGAANLNSTTQSFGSLAGNLNFNNLGTLNLGANNLSTVFTGNFNASAGSITKTGTGTQTFAGQNLYTGSTNINGGTLLIGSGTGVTSTASLGASAVTVGNGSLTGALGGNGTINGPVTVTSTGHLAPAMTPSTTNTLTINNSLTINSGATLDFNFAGPATNDTVARDRRGNAHDRRQYHAERHRPPGLGQGRL